MSIGKLYKSHGEQFVANVDYQLYGDSPTKLWGELVLDEYRRIDDGGGYVIELADKRKCQCHLRKRVNRAVSGLRPSFIYHFTGNSFISTLPTMA